MYSLGVLTEIEKMLGKPLCEVVDLVYGTSTGAIIAALIALGDDADSISEKYREFAPDVMKRWLPRRKSAILRRNARAIFGAKMFDEFVVDIGIVTTHLEYNRPMVFKRHKGQAHGSQASFKPGFGCPIAEAIVASCAAYPFFKACVLSTPAHGTRRVVDGGFTANNPALFALADAVGPLGRAPSDIRLLSVGTGRFPETKSWFQRTFSLFGVVKTLGPLLVANASTVEPLLNALFPDIQWLRINDAPVDANLRTSFTESKPEKLEAIFQAGRDSFGSAEKSLRSFFEEGSADAER